MLSEIVEIIRGTAAEVVISTIKSINAVISAAAKIMLLIRAHGASANPFEKAAVLALSLLVIYAMYRFLWDSAKLVVMFAIAVFLLFFFGAMII